MKRGVSLGQRKGRAFREKNKVESVKCSSIDNKTRRKRKKERCRWRHLGAPIRGKKGGREKKKLTFDPPIGPHAP